ncbi:ABC transporter ATP-binding protein [Kitasatospora sp. LaBMicrA B282]|uniref:ABC transporter ATP-binding protein n=1 Tax=Kitasatospora sp. LaBMicrA B282 TaxID=3420949 RepID=UPI003D13F1CD
MRRKGIEVAEQVEEQAEQDSAQQGEDEVADEQLEWRGGRRLTEAIEAISVSGMARRLPSLVYRAFALAWRIERRAVAALLVCQLLSAVLGAAGLLATTGTIAALFSPGDVNARVVHALPSIALIGAATGVRALLGRAIWALTARLSPRIAREAELTVLRATVEAELTAYDQAGFKDELEAADRGAEVCVDLLGEAQNLLSSAASMVGAAGVLTYLHPLLLPLLLIAALPEGIASVRGARVQYLANRVTISERRLMGNLRWYIAHCKGNADQLRSDTMGDFLLGRYAALGARMEKVLNEAIWQATKLAVLGATASGAGSLLVWAAMLWLVATGRMSLPNGGAAVFALRTVAGSLQGMVGYGADLFRTGLYLDDWANFLDKAGGQRLQRGTAAPGDPKTVAVESVVYRYPASERTALNGVTLTVNRGEIVALVGENGSGKTTLAKLLSGLYLPTEGAVTWDGRDTRELDPTALWKRVAVVPQDYARWPLIARENIDLGQPTPEGEAAVRRAAAAAGADEVLDGLRNGLGTLLAAEWLGGEELSGGQWQRIALARAFHRPAGLLVLDEPTAALDPRAEHRIFTGLRAIAADKAVVLVTHRLTNVAVADRIVVLHHGQVRQSGTFAELVAQDGLFRELWELQNDRAGIPAPRVGQAGRVISSSTSAVGRTSPKER